jgi:hypothetical protein
MEPTSLRASQSRICESLDLSIMSPRFRSNNKLLEEVRNRLHFVQVSLEYANLQTCQS